MAIATLVIPKHEPPPAEVLLSLSMKEAQALRVVVASWGESGDGTGIPGFVHNNQHVNRIRDALDKVVKYPSTSSRWDESTPKALLTGPLR